jgi:hypothetical protein
MDKTKAVVCILLTTSAIMLSEKKKRKRKMWSKKWYLKRNISCDANLLNELLETDDAIVVSAGKLRKLWDSLSELRSSLCERRLERAVLRPAPSPVKTAQFTKFFRQVRRHTEKSPSLTESLYGALVTRIRTPLDIISSELTCSETHWSDRHVRQKVILCPVYIDGCPAAVRRIRIHFQKKFTLKMRLSLGEKHIFEAL